MKKLMLSLIAVSSLAIANDLPVGNYSGFLVTPSGVSVNGSGVSEEAGIKVNLEQLPDLGNNTGLLTANIVLNGSEDCFNGTGNLHLDKPFRFISNWAVKASHCNYNAANGVFTGDYKLTMLPFLSGTFNFTKQ